MTTMLDLTDQLVFLGERATGATSLLQCVWTYDRAIDMDGLRRFHHHLLRGRLSRHVERSALPFGRHRWVSPNDAPAIEIAQARPREEFGAWLHEQTDIPLDYEHGPAWHLAVLPFTDGGTGLSLVISHGLTDGVGLTTALADAASARDDSVIWPPAGSRRPWRARRQDARQTVRDIPSVGRAIVGGARMARRARRQTAASTRGGAHVRADHGPGRTDRHPGRDRLHRHGRVGCPGPFARRDQQLTARRAGREIRTTGRPRQGRRRYGHLDDARQANA